MKTIKKMVLVAAVAFSTVLSASTPKETSTENARLGTEIKALLENHDFKLQDEVNLEVMLTLNADNEIVVLSVDNDDEALKNFIKSKLNYKKLSSAYKGEDKMFKIPVKLMPES